MNLKIKRCLIALTTLTLSYCQDAPSGRRIGGWNMQRQSQAGLLQSGDVFNQLPKQDMSLLKSYLDAKNARDATLQTVETPSSTITYSTDQDSRVACKGKGQSDFDNDGLPDDCELEKYPHVYNGWMVGGRTYDPKNSNLQLTPDEEIQWKEISKKYGGINLGNMSPTMKRLFKKMELARLPQHSDLDPAKYIYYDLSDAPLRISDRFSAPTRYEGAFDAKAIDDQNIGLAAGDGNETVPSPKFAITDSPSSITAIGDDINSYLTKVPVVLAWSTNVVLPKNTNHYKVTIAEAVDGDLRIKPKTSALYLVINHNDTVMLNSKLVSNTSGSLTKKYGEIYANNDCLTADLTVISFGIPQNEIIVFSTDGKNWSTLSQKDFVLQPIGGVNCQLAYAGANVYGDSKTFFEVSSSLSQRVPGVVDFSSVFSKSGEPSTKYMLGSGDTLDKIKNAVDQLPVESMNAKKVREFENAFNQIDPSAIQNQDDKTWYDQTKKLASDRNKILNDPATASKNLTDIAKLNAQLAGLDPSSKEYADMVDQIQKLLADVDSNISLSPAQRQELSKQNQEFENAQKTATSRALANSVASEAARRIIQYDPQGNVKITPESVLMLRKLGFIVKDEKGVPFVENGYAPKAGKITDETLDSLLGQLGERIQKGNLTQSEATAISKILEDLKKNKDIDQGKLKDFENEFGPALASSLSVKWPEDQIAYLKTLEADPKINPGFTSASLDQWSKGFAGTEEEAKAKEEALGKLEKSLLDTSPTALSKFPVGERKPYVDALKSNGFIDDKKYNDWIWKLNFIALWPKDEKMSKLKFKEIVVKGEKFRAMDININFATGKSDLNKNARNYLKFAVDVIRQIEASEGKQFYFLIQAHTDTVGSSASNLKLSQRRGDAAKKFVTSTALGDKKIDPTRIKSVGLGETQPIYTKPDGSEDFESNRRVEIIYSDKPF